MRMYDVIEKKRDGGELTDAETVPPTKSSSRVPARRRTASPSGMRPHFLTTTLTSFGGNDPLKVIDRAPKLVKVVVKK